MTKEVLISVSGLQSLNENDQTQPVEIIAPGEYYFRNGKHYLLYEEAEEGSGRITKNRLKIQENRLEVVKSGAVNVKMIFEPGRDDNICYQTPYGDMAFGMRTDAVALTASEDMLSVEVAYALSVNYEMFADCRICISAKSKNTPQ